MPNPFVYGEVVPAAAFVDRETELDRLTRDLLAGQKIFLISPRRYGKSSLVRQALRAAERGGALTVEVTVSSYSSYVAFLEGYARALLSVETRLDRAARVAARHARRRSARGAGRARRPRRQPARRSRSPPPARTGTSRGSRRRCSRCRDGSPRPGGAAWPSRSTSSRPSAPSTAASVEHALRAAVQHQRQVGYVFSGSEPSLMERMLGRSRPFYKAGPVMRLQKIPADRFAEFIEARFRATKLRPSAGLGAASSSWPAIFRTMCSASRTRCGTMPRARKVVGLDDLHETLKRLLGEHEALFEATWQRLTLAQRAALRAAVLEEGRELLSADVRARYRLGGPSTVQASLTRARARRRPRPRRRPATSSSTRLLREWVARHTH